MRNCAFSYTDTSGIDGCNGCLPGYIMNSYYSCIKPTSGMDPNCLIYGFRRSDASKALGCIQCYNGYFLNSQKICSALPSSLRGCATPNQQLSACLWCDGYNGYYESDVNSYGYKLCSSGGINWYQKSKQYISSGSLYSVVALIILGLFLRV